MELKHSEYTLNFTPSEKVQVETIETKYSVFSSVSKLQVTSGLNLRLSMSNRRRYTYYEK